MKPTHAIGVVSVSLVLWAPVLVALGIAPLEALGYLVGLWVVFALLFVSLWYGFSERT